MGRRPRKLPTPAPTASPRMPTSTVTHSGVPPDDDPLDELVLVLPADGVASLLTVKPYAPVNGSPSSSDLLRQTTAYPSELSPCIATVIFLALDLSICPFPVLTRLPNWS